MKNDLPESVVDAVTTERFNHALNANQALIAGAQAPTSNPEASQGYAMLLSLSPHSLRHALRILASIVKLDKGV